MNVFTPDENRRWNAWQDAYVISAKRGDDIARFFAAAMLTSTVVAVITMWRP